MRRWSAKCVIRGQCLRHGLCVQIDAGTLRTLCQQQGALRWFSVNSTQAIVRYSSREEATKALQALHGSALGNAILHAQVLPESDAVQLISQQTPSCQPAPTPTPAPPSSQWGQSPSSSSAPSSYPWNSAPPTGSEPRALWGPSLWDAPGGEQGSVSGLSNILGGEM